MSAPGFYEIRVGVRLDGENWSYWFEGFTVREEANGETVLSGPVVDQAALHGVLAKVRDLNLELISVNRIKRWRAPEKDGTSTSHADGRGTAAHREENPRLP